VVLGLLDQGASLTGVVDLLATAQEEAGRLWEENVWTVADEHLISGVTQRCLDAAAGGLELDQDGPHVVLTCAEGDWHSLPAQMFGELLRDRGFVVTQLGASTPAAHVAEFLARRPVDAVVITCSLPLHFIGVSSLVAVAHGRGIPALVGGRALRSNPGRALALGADASVETVGDVERVIRAWTEGTIRPPLEDVTPEAAVLRLREVSGEVAAQAFAALRERLPLIAEYDADQRARTQEDLIFITEFTAAARLVDDASVMAEFFGWLVPVLGHRGIPASALRAGGEALAPIVARLDPSAARLLSDWLPLSDGQIGTSGRV
jgi:methanogenic corrinoid protein MtbC1